MPRATLDKQINLLQDEVLMLGSMVESAILGSVDSLKKRDKALSRHIFHGDKRVNEKRFAIENAILVLIATQQPMAHDLRFLASILEVITELERIGDYAKGICKVNILMADEGLLVGMRQLGRMAEVAASMLHRALSAFINEDDELARSIPPEDDEVDQLYNEVYRELIRNMVANPKLIDQMSYMLWVAHNLERTADRVTNICERTIFIATGELMEIRDTDDEQFEEDD